MWISHIRLSDWLRGNTHGSNPGQRRRATASGDDNLHAALQLAQEVFGTTEACRLNVNGHSVPLSPAHQKQGPFPPLSLPSLNGHTTLSAFLNWPSSSRQRWKCDLHQ